MSESHSQSSSDPTSLHARLHTFVQRVVAGSTLAQRKEDALALIDAMTEGWGERPGDGPPHVSYLSRDGTPFEPSVRMRRGVPSDLRWVLEAQPEHPPGDARARFDAGMALNVRLAARGWIDLARVQHIADIFAAQPPRATAALWFGASLGPGGPPLIKNYFVCAAPEQWKQAFARLGLAALATQIEPHLPARSKVEFVSLDLDPSDTWRVKLYVRHRGLDFAAIDHAHALCPTYRPGDAERLVRAVFGAVPDVRKLGPISTFHIARGELTHSSVNVPLEPLHYTTPVPSDDLAIAMNIARFARSLGITIDPLYAHMLSVAMDDGVRYPHHRYCGLQRRGPGIEDPEITVYLSTLLQAPRHGLAYGPTRL